MKQAIIISAFPICMTLTLRYLYALKKFDETFTESQFLMDVFTPPWRMDKNESGRGIALYIREDIPSRHILEV